MNIYSDDDMLPLSGIQHFRFCPRQWALIHIDQAWEENRLTYEGQSLHKKVDDPFYRMKSSDILTLRSVNIVSKSLGLYGVMDLLELYPSDSNINTISHPLYPGHWIPFPVEYKHGKPKKDYIDEVQLVAQAICLEEMYGISIQEGAIFYNQIKHRQLVEFTQDLRNEAIKCSNQMHLLFSEGRIPQPERSHKCRNCSLIDLCLPEFGSLPDPQRYLKSNLYEETP